MNTRENATMPGALTSFDRAAVDRSCRDAVLAYFTSAVFWLLVGSFFALLAAYKFNAPDWLGEYPTLTLGRLRSAHLNAVIYGWASMSGTGVLLWIIARTARTELRGGRFVVYSSYLWNAGVAFGVGSILAGHATGLEWLEFPTATVYALTFAFIAIALSAYRTFRARRVHHLYISLWYMLAASIWFPMLYFIGAAPHYAGVPQAAMNWWFAHNTLGVWFTPIGLGAIYFFIPKVTGKPIYSYYLSMLGFWTFGLFYNWNGIHHLIGGPAPVWLITTSITASYLMVIPVIVVGVNHHMTVVGSFRAVLYSPTLRFVVFGAIAYTAVSLQGSLEANRTFNSVVHFTHYTVGHAHLGLYAFFSMVMFGAYYYMMPRLVRWEWGNPGFIKLHFWLSGGGVAIYVTSLTVGGFLQGLAMNDATRPFIDSVELTKPYLLARSVGGTLMTLGHIVFAVMYVRMRWRMGTPRAAPAYLTDPGPMTAEAGAMAHEDER